MKGEKEKKLSDNSMQMTETQLTVEEMKNHLVSSGHTEKEVFPTESAPVRETAVTVHIVIDVTRSSPLIILYFKPESNI